MFPPMFKTLFLSFKRPMGFIKSSAIQDAWLAGDCTDCGPQFSDSGEGGQKVLE